MIYLERQTVCASARNDGRIELYHQPPLLFTFYLLLIPLLLIVVVDHPRVHSVMRVFLGTFFSPVLWLLVTFLQCTAVCVHSAREIEKTKNRGKNKRAWKSSNASYWLYFLHQNRRRRKRSTSTGSCSRQRRWLSLILEQRLLSSFRIVKCALLILDWGGRNEILFC